MTFISLPGSATRARPRTATPITVRNAVNIDKRSTNYSLEPTVRESLARRCIIILADNKIVNYQNSEEVSQINYLKKITSVWLKFIINYSQTHSRIDEVIHYPNESPEDFVNSSMNMNIIS